MSEEKKGIKETRELINGLEVVGIFVAKVAKDGKVNALDVQHLPELASKHEVLIEAFTGLSGLKDEIKDLDGTEAIQLLTELVDAADKVKAV